MHINIDDTDQIRKRYNRIAFFYNLLEAPLEWLRFRQWRNRLRKKITGPMVLEAGVGTGKNLHHYPLDVVVTAIDFSPRMLSYAKKSASKLNLNVEFHLTDVQQLDFPDNYFDTIFATFVFCSVPDPIAGLKELKRVCKPDGKLILIEHIRPGNVILGFVFDVLNPLIVQVMGANINRRTLENIVKAGWKIRVKEKLSSDIVWWIEAKAD